MMYQTVAVYSQADADSPFVMADQAVALNANAASETYLDIGLIIEAARHRARMPFILAMGFCLRMLSLRALAPKRISLLSGRHPLPSTRWVTRELPNA